MRYMKNTLTGVVLPYTELLARRDYMVECDASGRVGAVQAEREVEAKPESASAEPALKIVKPPAAPFGPFAFDDAPAKPDAPSIPDNLDSMGRKELIEEAAKLGFRIHANAKDDTIRERIREAGKG